MGIDVIEERIKKVNKKSITISVVGSILAGFIAYPFGPASELCFLIGWISLFSSFSFAIIYKSSFYFFGKDLIDEAKKRGKYLVRWNEQAQSTGIGDELRYNINYSHLPGNIYYVDESTE